MNDKLIAELAYKANMTVFPSGLTEFAELIIQECIAQVKLELGNRQLLLSNPPQNAGVWDACNNIRRHFGVER